MATVYYSDPLFDEVYSKIPEESRRMSAHSFAIAAHICEILERKGWNKTDFAIAMGKKNSEIAEALGINVSTVIKYFKGDK